MNVNVCTDFELLEVEVPLIFLDVGCFSTSSDGRYVLSDNVTTAAIVSSRPPVVNVMLGAHTDRLRFLCNNGESFDDTLRKGELMFFVLLPDACKDRRRFSGALL